MAVKPVYRLPERVLKQPAEAIAADWSAEEDELARHLVDTMRASPACVGLAAPQIGISRRMFVVDVSQHPKTTVAHGEIVMADPIVVEMGGRKSGREGCMSVPDLTANVVRAQRLVVQGVVPGGEVRVIETEDFEARAFQHEIDHLDGLLILDRVASLATDVFRRKVYR